MKKTLFAALLAAFSLSTFAEEEAKTEYVYIPHFYVQAQGGAQYTLGEIDFSDLISPNAQFAVGYNFGKVIGARLAFNAWQSKGGSEFNNAFTGKSYSWKWKYNYVAPTIDVTFNLSNLISGYNPKRLVDVSAFIGGGVNIHWNNDERLAAYQEMTAAGYSFINQTVEEPYNWKGTKCTAVGRAGLNVDFKVAKHWTVGAEFNANFTGDRYNSKRAGNVDWYFNGLVGVKYAFGKIYEEKKIEAPQPQIIYKDRIVEKIVEKPVEAKQVVVEKDPLRIDVFFTIASTKLVGSEAQKVNEVANYLKKYPEAKVTLTGYADKGTGNATINKNLSIKRADIVKNELIDKYGISADRITTDAKGDTVQPFDVEVLNRVTICIAK